ncbi:MAG: tRNA (adenosine(37)-N6)-dimethylallyltransferase MiaA [Candidatus Omnitrophica bacterium]|nr:tRNA (adenosine(37)-N6)-dimethylallyltransferase MiaA [Candidatus Omnitrophota bacterium]
MRSKVLVIAGPTGSGKTDVALEILRRIPAEAVSFDSMQVYRSMPLLTQAPPQAPQTHLVSFLSPLKAYSAALFRKDATKLIRQILARGKTPLLVGGTGLYLRALLDGLFEPAGERPARDETLRREMLAEHEKKGEGYLYAELAKRDPVSARRIHPNDTRRIVRALEVFRLTGQPLSEQLHRRSGLRNELDFNIYLLERMRDDLYDRINRRVERMVKDGLVEEVRRLAKKRLSLTARMALGVREIGAYLEGRCALEEAKELLKKNTRNYAKRQLSWFRHEKGTVPVPASPGETPRRVAGKILAQWGK